MGHAFVHAAVDDHSRLAYAEIHDDETAATALGFLHRAVAWFAARGITIERVLSDNGSCYRSKAWRQTCTELGIKAKYTRAYRPQTNGKVERFNRTLANEWAFASDAFARERLGRDRALGELWRTAYGPRLLP